MSQDSTKSPILDPATDSEPQASDREPVPNPEGATEAPQGTDEAPFATVRTTVEDLGIPALDPYPTPSTVADEGDRDPTLSTVAVRAVEPASSEAGSTDEPAAEAVAEGSSGLVTLSPPSSPESSSPAGPTPAIASSTVPSPAIPSPAVATPPTTAAAAPPAAYGVGSDLGRAMGVMSRLRERMRAQVLGRDEVIDLVLVALLADGHVLLEDFPGSGKTTLAKSLGESIIDDRPENASAEDGGISPFRRIQFTPDLLPSDVTGVSVFDPASNRFHFRHGPIFAHVLLADEINRTSPKVQSAMLEAMAEKQVTVDNVTHPLDDLFFVIATQNPLDLAGTYPLPVAQLDRFLFKIRMDHIDRGSELEVLQTYRRRRDTARTDLPKVTRDEVIEARKALDEGVSIDPRIQEALVDISQALRNDERVAQGNSTRSLVLLLPALQARAALMGRDYVVSDDLEHLLPRVLGHRIELAPGVGQLDVVLREAMEASIEGLARSTLRGSSHLWSR